MPRQVQMIRVDVRDVFGRRLIYPVCDDAKTFAALAGTKTLTPEVLDLIKALGFEIEVVVPVL